MACERVGGAIICSRGGAARCACGRKAVALCDAPVRDASGQWHTCDSGICDEHRTRANDEVDYCQAHQTPESRGVAL